MRWSTDVGPHIWPFCYFRANWESLTPYAQQFSVFEKLVDNLEASTVRAG